MFLAFGNVSAHSPRAREAEAGARTIPTGDLSIDFRTATARWRGETYPLSPLGPAAQELVLAGGLEALTRGRMGL